MKEVMSRRSRTGRLQCGEKGGGKSDQKERVARRAVSSWAVVEQISPDAERITPECCAILGAAKRHFCQV